MRSLKINHSLSLFALSLLSIFTISAHASTLSTYRFTLNYFDFLGSGTVASYSFDLTTNDSCTLCDFSDLTSPVMSNQQFTVSSSSDSLMIGNYDGATHNDVVSLDIVNFSTSGSVFYLEAFNTLQFTSTTIPGNTVQASVDLTNDFGDLAFTDTTIFDPLYSNGYTLHFSSAEVNLIGTVSSVPLPPSLVLFGSGLVGLGALRRKGEARNAYPIDPIV